MKTDKYFATCQSVTVQLTRVQYGYASDFRGVTAMPARTVNYPSAYGGGQPTVYMYAIGNCPTCNLPHFAERHIARPSNASNHKCGGKCRSARGPNCECSCGGVNHGAN